MCRRSERRIKVRLRVVQGKNALHEAKQTRRLTAMSARGFRSLGARLSLWIALPGALLFVSVLATNYFLSRDLLKSYVGELARTTAASTVYELATVLNSVSENADALASLVSKVELDAPRIRASIRAMLANDEYIFGMAVALEPHLLYTGIGRFSPYYYRKDGAFAYADLASDDYDYEKWDWYTRPKAENRPLWSEPYLDTGGGGVLMTTYSTPIRTSTDDRFAGVATADIALDWLQNVVRTIHIAKTGFGFIVTDKDTVIAHPNPEYNLVPLRTVSGEWPLPASRGPDPEKKNSETTQYFYGACHHQPGMCWTAVEALGQTGWKVYIVVPERELIADIKELTIRIAVVASAGLLILPLIVVLITRWLTKPLGLLAQSTRDIGAGNLDTSLPAPVRQDEIGALTADFTGMRDSLKDYLVKLRKSTAKQQALESEIRIASDIQMSMLTGAGHADVSEDGCQLFALLRPAQSVGGDLYYFHRYGDELHFIIGDVSDKGVPAALFMAEAITLYTSALGDGLSPASILVRMNDALCRNNDACMFVTALCGRLHIHSGQLLMANAGHMYPLLKTLRQTLKLPVDGGTALGLRDDAGYADVNLRLPADSVLLMYTDGITEAFNASGEQYSEQRLRKFVTRSEMMLPQPLGDALIDDVERFSAGTDQSDDITLLLIRYGEV
jgi:sigma-B regulation protein RsbU (phosphoserine phosphatase)